MKIFNHINIVKKYKNSALAIGNFDGVHKGHQKVFRESKKFSRKQNIKFGVLTFSPLPVMFFNKNLKNYRLASEDQKLIFFKKNKVDFIIRIVFNKNFSEVTAENFIKNIIYKKINPKLLAVSNNFKFGKNRQGNISLLNKFSKDPINPLIGAAGVSAVPMAARVVSKVGNEEDPSNVLLMHAMGPNVAGVIGSAVAAGVLISIFA